MRGWQEKAKFPLISKSGGLSELTTSKGTEPSVLTYPIYEVREDDLDGMHLPDWGGYYHVYVFSRILANDISQNNGYGLSASSYYRGQIWNVGGTISGVAAGLVHEGFGICSVSNGDGIAPGTITSSGIGVWQANNSDVLSFSIYNNSGSLIRGGMTQGGIGVLMSGPSNLENHWEGSIEGYIGVQIGEEGAPVSRGSFINNKGFLRGISTGIEVFGKGNIYNFGTISGSLYGIKINNDSTADTINSIWNSGTISVNISGYAIYGSTIRDSIYNQGQITGTLSLQGGNDSYIGSSTDPESGVVYNGTVTGTIELGTGNDTATGGANSDTINGGLGDDSIDGGDGIDTAEFTDGTRDRVIDLTLTTAQDTGEGLDVILNIENVRTGGGNDTVIGNDLANSIDGGNGNDTLTGGGGNDTLIGGSSNDTLNGDSEEDSLNGGLGNDSLIGGSENDTLIGASGNDTLIGGSGNDRLIGNSERDVLTGSTGADVFVFASASDMPLAFLTNGTAVNTAVLDTITDFSASSSDRIDISAIDANNVTAGVQDFTAIIAAGSAFTAAGQLRYNAATGLLEANTDADATAEFAILISNRPASMLLSYFIL